MSFDVWDGGLSLAGFQGDLGHGPGGQRTEGSAEAISTTEPSPESATGGSSGQPTAGSGSTEAASPTPPSLDSATGMSDGQPAALGPATGGSDGQLTAGSGSGEAISTSAAGLSPPDTSEGLGREHDLSDCADGHVCYLLVT